MKPRTRLGSPAFLTLLSGAGQGIHCEILLRMIDEDGSLILPGTILPAAERFHMTPRIDRWVLRRVFEWMSRVPGGLGAVDMIAVNLSGQSLGDRAFHRFVTDLIAQSSCDVGKLCLEVTETSAITHLHDAAEFVSGMRALGVRVALDDFGAGFSTTTRLDWLECDELKIDRALVDGLEHSHEQRCVVENLVALAHSHGMTALAEGVETEAALAILCESGCDRAQGFLVARPLPCGELAARARNWQARALEAATAGERQLSLPGFGITTAWWNQGELDAIA